MTVKLSVSFFENGSAFIHRYLPLEMSRNASPSTFLHIKLLISLQRKSYVSVICFLNNRQLHQKPRNIGSCPQRLNCHQTIGDVFRDCPWRAPLRMKQQSGQEWFKSRGRYTALVMQTGVQSQEPIFLINQTRHQIRSLQELKESSYVPVVGLMVLNQLMNTLHE